MKIKLSKHYKVTLIIISILLLFCITLGISYAYWQITHKQTGNNNIASGCFDVTFEETGNDISLSNTFPVSDQEGLSSAPYKFKIKNICTIDTEYYVTLNSFGATDKLLNENSIKYAFDLSSKNSPTPKILGTASENTETGYININNLIKSYYLKGGHLRAGEEREFSLYLWIDKDAPISEMNKTFSSKIFVTSIATEEAPLIANLRIALNGDGTTNYLNGPLVKNTIEKLEFVESNKAPTDAIGSWDVSEQQNGAITAWYYDSDKNGKYEVYIGQEEGVVANSNSSSLFRSLENLNKLNLDQLIVSDVTNMSSMFYCTGYNSTIFTLDLGDEFNTSKVTNMGSMFYGTGYSSTVFTLDLGDNFDTSNATIMSSMFSNVGYSSLVFTLDLGNFFNTSNVTNMSYMFRYTGYSSSIFVLSLGDKFDTSNVTTMNYMFAYIGYNSEVFTLSLKNKFDTSKVTTMERMFHWAGRSSTVFTLDLRDKFDTSNVTNMSWMFAEMGKLSLVLTLNLGDKFDTSNVTTTESMFWYTGHYSTVFALDLGNKFDTSKVTNMTRMFGATGYSSPTFTLDLGDKFDTSNVTTMYYMFQNAGYKSTVFTLDLRDKFDTSKVTNMDYMFNYTGYSNPVFTLNFGSKFDTSNVTNMEGIFYRTGYGNTKLILNLRTFSFDKVTSYDNIFASSKATQIAYVKSATDKTWVSDKGFAGSIIDCSSNTCP